MPHECILHRLRENSGGKRVKVKKKLEEKEESCSANVALHQQNDASRKSGCFFFQYAEVALGTLPFTSTVW